MPDNMIHSFTECPVGRRFEVEWAILPMAKSRKGFHVYSFATIDVGGTGGFLYYPKLASLLSEWPELTAHFIDGAKGFEGINRDLMNGRAGTSGFGFDSQTRLVGGFACCAVICIYEKIAQHFSIVINESGSSILIFHDATGQGGGAR